MNTLKTVTTEKMRAKMERLAKNVSKVHSLTLKFQSGKGSYSTQNKNGFFISVDPAMAWDEKEDTLESLVAKIQGITAHEAGHLAYSDFKVVERNNAFMKNAQKSIPVIAKDIDPQNIDNSVCDSLKVAIHDYIRGKNMMDMFNSIEDGAIEHLVPLAYPRMYGSIVLMRDMIIKEERKCLYQDSSSKNIIQRAITEMRHFATYAYRDQTYTPIILPTMFSPEEVEEIKKLSIYGRLVAETSNERNAISEVLMDYLEPLIQEKTEDFFGQYMSNLLMANMMSGQDLLDMLNDEMPEEQELTIRGQLDPNLAKNLKPHTPPKSDYEMDLPQNLQDKINQKMQEQQQQNDGEGQGQSSSQDSGEGQGQGQEQDENVPSENNQGSKSGQSEKDSASNNDSGKNEEGEGSENSKSADSKEENEGSKGSDSGKEKDKNGSDNDASDLNSESKDSEDASEEKNGKGKEGKATDNDSSDTENAEDGDTGTNDSEETAKSDNEAKEYDADAERRMAKDSVRETLTNLSKELEKVRKTELKHDIENGGQGKAPTLSEKMGNVNNISEIHKGIDVEYYSYKKDTSYLNFPQFENNQEIMKQASQFSKKLKEELMYQAKVRRKNGLKSGKLNDSALSRVITDQRCFRKTIQGIEKKGRIEVLIDLSGSMWGEKLTDAVRAAYMLATACAKIKVPVSVMGHNADTTVYLHHFLEFEDYLKPEMRKNILRADAGHANRDGLAIFHASTDLVRHRKKNENLILLVISDGAPNAYDYGGQEAVKDIQRIYEMFEEEYDVHTIGIGIGNDTRHVPKIYKDFVLVPNVHSLGDELLKIIKEKVL